MGSMTGWIDRWFEKRRHRKNLKRLSMILRDHSQQVTGILYRSETFVGYKDRQYTYLETLARLVKVDDPNDHTVFQCTTACGIGLGLIYGIRCDHPGVKNWDQYMLDVYGIDKSSDVYYFLFHPLWDCEDDTSYRLAERIKFYLKFGTVGRMFAGISKLRYPGKRCSHDSIVFAMMRWNSSVERLF